MRSLLCNTVRVPLLFRGGLVCRLPMPRSERIAAVIVFSIFLFAEIKIELFTIKK